MEKKNYLEENFVTRVERRSQSRTVERPFRDLATSSAHLRACFAKETEPDSNMEPGSVSASASRRRQRDQY